MHSNCQVIDVAMDGNSSNSSSSSSSSNDSSDDKVTSLLLKDDGTQFTSGMLLFALHIEKYLTRSEYRVPLVTRLT
jgi:hypothetical protein